MVFMCGICGKTFEKSNELRKHAKYHDEDSPTNCGICDNIFKSSLSMKEHLRKAHGEKKKCNLCIFEGNAFVSKFQ